jgi:hypothetical protein
MSNNTIPLPLEGGSGDDDAGYATGVAKRREMRDRETILVHTLVTGIAQPLARAFKGMPETGLLTTRYQLYRNTVEMIFDRGDHVIPLMPHDVKVDDLIDNILRTTEAGS